MEPKREASGVSEELIEELYALDGPVALLELLARRPDLEGGSTADDLRAMAELPGYGRGISMFVELIAGARSNLAEAWAAFERRRAEITQIAEELAPVLDEVEDAAERGDYEAVVGVAEAAAKRAESAGLGLGAGRFYALLGVALLRRGSPDRASDLERAIEANERALELAGSPEQAVQALSHLAIVLSERIRGDRAENLERAVALLRRALDEVAESGDDDVEALVQTNLAMALIRSESGERVAALREAADLCRAALTVRSPDRDAVDWAYSQLNLGEALQLLAALEETDAGEAIAAYECVILEAARVGDPWLVGIAHHALGNMRLSAARVIAAEQKNPEAAPSPDAEEERLRMLETAREHLEAAERAVIGAPDRLRHALVLNDLADVLVELNQGDDALVRSRKALAILRPTASPHACARAGGRLGHLLAERGEWPEAASAFSDAVAASELLFRGRLETESRQEQTRQSGNVTRWAAFAIARAGDPLAAALVLENGRAQELRRRLGLEMIAADDLDRVPTELRSALEDAVGELVASPIGSAGAAAAYRFQSLLAAIREQPGFEQFAAGATRDDLSAAVEPTWPLIYVDPTPYGTLLLELRRDGDSLIAEAETLDQPRALDVFLQLMLGREEAELATLEREEAELGSETAELAGSFLLGISGHGDLTRDFKRDLEQPLAWIGGKIARPIRDIATRNGATGVTLVCCGPISVAPLHAAPWSEGGRDRCLIDELDVRYAPAATVAAAALRRAAHRIPEDARLVVLADPTGDLPAARPEAAEIAGSFNGERVAVAVGARADRAFLGSNAPAADYLHLACHADGAVFEADDSAVYLADGPVPAVELAALRLTARLAAISACQTALAEIGDLPDEVLSIGNAMLAAGAACAIASLWPVDDLATALLMTRLYDEMIGNDRSPPEALRTAQLWLRSLTSAGEAAFVAQHPALAVEHARRAARDDLPGRRTSQRRRIDPPPYAHPDYWAAFIALGA